MGRNAFWEACARLLRHRSGHSTAQGAYREIEVPETIKRLICAINDGAASAQRVLVPFALLGLYLVATAFSTSDYDLLLGASKPIAQLDVQVPIVVSFAVAPVLFVLAHAFALTRYELLSRELADFKKELSSFSEKFNKEIDIRNNTERHSRELLSNIEFIEVFLESVRDHVVALPNLRSMSRMDANWRNAWALRLRHSQSLARRRQRFSQAKVRSTTHRLGRTTKPLT